MGGSPAWRFAASEYLGTIGAVRLRLLQGGGIAVLPRYVVAGDFSPRGLRRLLPKIKLQYGTIRLVWRQGHPSSEAIKRLAERLQLMPLK
jgi:DNA-binding transcriptional LysR family regulator